MEEGENTDVDGAPTVSATNLCVSLSIRYFPWCPWKILSMSPQPDPHTSGWFRQWDHLTTQGQTQDFYFFRLKKVDLSGLSSKISPYIFFQHSWVKGQTEIWKRWLLPLWGRRIPTELGTYMNSDLQSFPLFMRSLDLLLLSPIYKELWLDQGKEY